MNNTAVTPEEFVKEFWLLKNQYLSSVTNDSQSLAHQLLQNLNLTKEQNAALPEFLDVMLTDVLYTVLLGLDGATQIGEKQVMYSVLDEEGGKICGEMGEVEAFAYEYFHSQKQ
jgi:signal transduction protein with GAF and PtsI domain